MSFEFRSIVCPTCGVDDTELCGRRGGVAHRAGAGQVCTIVRCRRCSLLYPNPFPFPTDLDALYSNTDDYFYAHPDQETKTAFREILITDLEQLTAGRRLLDVGAGLGETVAAATRRGWDAYGVDTAARFVKRAEQLCPGRIFQGSLDDVPSAITSQPFDAVVLAAVLEHLHEPGKMLASIARLLKPSGIIFLDVPNESGLYFWIGNLWNKLQGRDWVVNLAPTFSPYHVFGFNRKSLTKILHVNGFQIERLNIYPGRSLLPLRKISQRSG